MEPKPQQIVQGVRKSFLSLKQRYKKMTIIFVLCSIVLVLLFTGIAIGAWQLYLKSHKETKISAFDLNKITKIKSPEIINAKNVYQVEADEIRDSLKYLIFNGIAEYSKGITFKDYDYQLFSNNKGAIFQPVNLSTTGLEIWLMITVAANSKLLMNNTNYLSVKLPALGNNKVSIAGINALTGPKLVSFPDPGNVTEINIRKVYDDVIKQTINEIANQAQLNVDYSYKIYADENEKEYQSVDLVNSSINIWIVIRAY
ncbi:hypothetical protein [Spiroplasma endosymbiont of Stenodema calcarata]|uniref:hypothetical protein n=1 Tax=Spiroplasma endosymbiont of Stenodema calcarata TaxID=3139328 RepID=UPI003CCB0134